MYGMPCRWERWAICAIMRLGRLLPSHAVPHAQGPMTASQKFDGHYYDEIANGAGRGGWFSSDRALVQASVPLGSGLTDVVRCLPGTVRLRV